MMAVSAADEVKRRHLMNIESRLIVVAGVDRHKLRTLFNRRNFVETEKPREDFGIDVEVVRREVPVASFQALSNHEQWRVNVMNGGSGTDGCGHCDISAAVRSQEEAVIENHTRCSSQKFGRRCPDQVATR